MIPKPVVPDTMQRINTRYGLVMACKRGESLSVFYTLNGGSHVVNVPFNHGAVPYFVDAAEVEHLLEQERVWAI